ncbi:hypothetical protein BBO99_00003647 [Phytophthora kernoviae]|uniref:BTB domain-containing protein n=1 Tax=Phytophthora kernoviae TaxID=325452 RepID=A0A3R7HBD7_9STRA|nr:hypothetical protein JM16_003527 [Phytophthora kernoviae]RLN44597.1 hypothetical protein BBI17_003684 [Phytophthora kernoviae]RLN81506.1 hypothetical protein BBO99_00003647 [Phytophthora kernoviae]
MHLATEVAATEDLLEAEVHAFLRDANLGGDLSLCEFTQWASRRELCNLVVLVCGTQFNLHKHPMLFESQKLHRMARENLEAADSSSCGGAVPVLELSAFPGGADMFETLAIYCYTGEISFSLANLAVMHCAIEFLEMGEDIQQSAKRFLNQQMSQISGGLDCLLQVVNAAETLAQAEPELFRSACESLVASCMDALVERGSVVDADTMLQFFTLPSQRFTELTQRLLTSKVLPSSAPRSESDIATELCVQAKLAQLHRDSNRSPSPSHRIKAQQCVQLLRGEAPDSPKLEKFEMKEEPLDLEVLLSADNSDKLLLKLMDEDLSACTVTTATSALVDASISFGGDSFRFGTPTSMTTTTPAPAPAAVAPAKEAPASSSSWIGYAAMVLLAMQFGLQPILYKEFAGNVKNSSVLVIACEVFKLLLSLLTLMSSGALGSVIKTWNLHDSLMASGLPACTYAIQNVLIQIAYQHLPSIVFNLINQTKLLSAALFLYFLMGTRFSFQQCFAMLLLLSAAVLLSLAKNGGGDDSAAPALSVELGLVPVLLASLLSGLGSALTQRSMQQHKRDAALVTMELSVYGSLFLMLPAIWSTIVKTPASESPAVNVIKNLDKVFEGCNYYTLIPVVSNALGGILVGTVTKHVGGVLKSFALICGIAFTAFVESYVYGAVLPQEVFIAAGLVAISMTIYSSFPYVKKEAKAKKE